MKPSREVLRVYKAAMRFYAITDYHEQHNASTPAEFKGCVYCALLRACAAALKKEGKK